MNKIVAGLLIYLLAVGQAWPQAALLPNAKQTFLDNVGNPLAGGKVYFYVPGSTNKKTTWLNSDQTSNNTNPVILDSAGRAVIYGQGNYRQVVQTSAGVQIWDALTTAYGSSQPSGATGTDTAPVGSVIPWASFVAPTNWQFAYGQALSRTDFPDLLTAITISDTSVNCTASSTTLTGFADTSQIRVGAPIEATCMSTGITVASIVNSTTITISSAATSTATVTATVFPWGNGDGVTTFNVPDFRGYVPAGPDCLGGTCANRLQATTTITTVSGALTATVASATGIAIGSVVSSVNVPLGATVTELSGTIVTLSNNATASASGTSAQFQSFQSSGQPASFGGLAARVRTVPELAVHAHNAYIRDPGHRHSFTSPSVPGSTTASAPPTGGGTGFTDPNITGVRVNSATGGTGTDDLTATSGGGNPALIVQPTIVINYIIKVKPNATGAGGVVSWGGLIGDIVTDQTLQGYTVGDINYAGIANADDARMLANITGTTAQPLPVSNTQWLDYTVGSARGTLAYRGASSWGALALGASDTWLKSDGTDAAWTALPVASAAQLGIVQGDGDTLSISGPGVISCSTATSSQIGCSKPDGTTIVAVGGTLTAVGAATTSIGVGTTTVAAGTNGYLLYDNAGVLGAQSFSGLFDATFGSTQGSIIYRNASDWVSLTPGTAGQFLSTGGAGANVAWASALTAVTLTPGNGLASSGTCSGSSINCTLSADIATNSNIWGATANKLLDAGNVFNSAGQLVALALTGTTVPVDMGTGFNFTYTATSGTNYTLANPTNAKVGQQGCIYLVQATPLTATITYGSNWKSAGGASGKALSATPSAVDRLCYFVRTTSFIDFTLATGIQ